MDDIADVGFLIARASRDIRGATHNRDRAPVMLNFCRMHLRELVVPRDENAGLVVLREHLE